MFEFAKEVLSHEILVRTFAINRIANYCIDNELCFSFPWFVE